VRDRFYVDGNFSTVEVGSRDNRLDQVDCFPMCWGFCNASVLFAFQLQLKLKSVCGWDILY
jgi:hypothetical protein